MTPFLIEQGADLGAQMTVHVCCGDNVLQIDGLIRTREKILHQTLASMTKKTRSHPPLTVEILMNMENAQNTNSVKWDQ